MVAENILSCWFLVSFVYLVQTLNVEHGTLVVGLEDDYLQKRITEKLIIQDKKFDTMTNTYWKGQIFRFKLSEMDYWVRQKNEQGKILNSTQNQSPFKSQSRKTTLKKPSRKKCGNG